MQLKTRILQRNINKILLLFDKNVSYNIFFGFIFLSFKYVCAFVFVFFSLLPSLANKRIQFPLHCK